MKESVKWRMPPEYLRLKRDARPLKSLVNCFLSAIFLGIFAFSGLSYFLWKPRQPFPLEIIFAAIGVVFVSTILRYWLMPFFSPSITLLNESLNLQHGRSTSRYRFENITECRMRRINGKTKGYTLMNVRSNLENETAFFRLRLREKIEIGIPDSIDTGQIIQMLRNGGVNVVTG